MPAERRGVTEPPLCGRARGAVVSGGAIERELRLLCLPCVGAFKLANCCSTLTCHVIVPFARVAAPDPELPRITWTAASPPPEPVRQGLVGCIELGQTEAAMMFGGFLYKGIVTRFQHPYYQVTYADGDVEEYTEREWARILKSVSYTHLTLPTTPYV